MTFFDRDNDRYHLSDGDLLVCLDDDVSRHSAFAEKNTSNAVTVLTSDEAISHFLDNVPNEYIL